MTSETNLTCVVIPLKGIRTRRIATAGSRGMPLYEGVQTPGIDSAATH
jgi:hypothetical protein